MSNLAIRKDFYGNSALTETFYGDSLRKDFLYEGIERFARPASRFWKAMAIIVPIAVAAAFGAVRLATPHLPFAFGAIESVGFSAIGGIFAKLYQEKIGAIPNEVLRQVKQSIRSKEITTLSDAKTAYSRLLEIARAEHRSIRHKVLQS